MNFDIIDLIVIAYVMAPLAIIIFAVGVWVGRLKEKTIAQAAMINDMRSGDELTEDDHKEIAAKVRQKMKEADEAWIPGEL